MPFFEIFLLSLIEGITEFLPISSTGHLIIASHFLGLNDEFSVNFNIIIQFGAILSVLFIYWKKFLPIKLNFYSRIAIAFAPSVVIGLLFKKSIDLLLSDISVVAWALLAGGVILLLIDRKIRKQDYAHRNLLEIENLPLKTALIIGIFQCLAFIPGVSRSAATIVGGILLGVDRKTATEFSFFLAVPTLAAATLLKVIKIYPLIQSDQITSLLLGLFLSFLFALIAIKGFVKFVSKGVFKWFGIYRILIGGALLFWFI